MLFFLLKNRILNCFSSSKEVCFQKATISFLIKPLYNFHYFLLRVEQPVAQLRSQPTVLPDNLQNYQRQTAPDFPASSMPVGANLPNFVDSQTQNNARQNQFCHPNNEPSNLIVDNSHASASKAYFDRVTQLRNLDYKHSFILPPIKLQTFNGDPLHFHECINNFYSMIHHNTTITDTHRKTHLQNSVSGKAKDLIHA